MRSTLPNEQKIGDYYASCMDEDAIQAAGLKPLQPEFDRIAALNDKKDLTDLLAHYQMINVNAFFGYGEQQDFKDAQKQIAVVDQGGLGLPERDYYFRTGDAAEKTRKEYVEHVANMLHLMGEPADQATCRRAKNHGAGNGAGQGLDGRYLAARSEQHLPPDDDGQAG